MFSTLQGRSGWRRAAGCPAEEFAKRMCAAAGVQSAKRDFSTQSTVYTSEEYVHSGARALLRPSDILACVFTSSGQWLQ